MKDNPDIINAPTISFLNSEEAEWVRFVNMKGWFERESQQEFVDGADNIVLLAHRFLDAVVLAPEERDLALEGVAEEISKRLRGVDQSLVPNPHFDINADWTDPMQALATKPFFFANVEGVAGMYASLGRFLASPFARRLGRCTVCSGLYLASHDEGFVCCAEKKC